MLHVLYVDSSTTFTVVSIACAPFRIAEVDVVSASHNLFKFSSQVAEGMRYLEGHQFVHQHLSARNVLLDEGHNCKVNTVEPL